MKIKKIVMIVSILIISIMNSMQNDANASFYKYLDDYERSGVFIAGDLGLGIYHTVGRGHPDVPPIEGDVGWTTSIKIGYFLNSSMGVYISQHRNTSLDYFTNTAGVALFMDFNIPDKYVVPYLYCGVCYPTGYEILGKADYDSTDLIGVSVGFGVPISKRLCIDFHLGLWAFPINYESYQFGVGSRRDAVATLTIAYWLY